MKTLLAVLILAGAGYLYFQHVRDSRDAEAIKALEALNTATKVGLPLAEYSRRTIDAAVVVDRTIPEISDPQRRAATQAIMDCYALAREYWSFSVDRSRRHPSELDEIDRKSRELGVDLDLNFASRSDQVAKYWAVAQARLADLKNRVNRDYALPHRPVAEPAEVSLNSPATRPKPKPGAKPGEWMWKEKGTLDRRPY